jgi:hypothetical protein
MGERISNWLYQVSTGRVAASALVLLMVFLVLVLPRQAAVAERESQGAGSPDTSFVYTTADLYRMAEAYGRQGRAAYVRARFTFDLIWPLVYTLFLATGMSWVYSRAFAPGSPWRRANLAPLLGALFDYLENLSASLVMVRYPNPTPVIDRLAPLFTVLKWTFVAGSFALLLIGLVLALWQVIRARIKG